MPLEFLKKQGFKLLEENEKPLFDLEDIKDENLFTINRPCIYEGVDYIKAISNKSVRPITYERVKGLGFRLYEISPSVWKQKGAITKGPLFQGQKKQYFLLRKKQKKPLYSTMTYADKIPENMIFLYDSNKKRIRIRHIDVLSRRGMSRWKKIRK